MSTEIELPVEQEEVFILDPRKKRCWEFYIGIKSETMGNAYQSAMRAGYAESYAATITTRPWFIEKKRRFNLVSKAEKALDKTLEYVTDAVNEKGEMHIDKELLRIQTDVAKYITKTLGKEEGYAERNELTGKDGSAIVFLPQELMDKYQLGEKSLETPVEETPVIEVK